MNPVAKNAHKFNRCVAHRDRTKYTRSKFVWDDEEPPVSKDQYLLEVLYENTNTNTRGYL